MPFSFCCMNKRVTKFAACVEYDGSAFRGWQRQPQVDTIQFRVEKALSRVANESIDTVVAGRTDAGVHATGQVIHFESSARRQEYEWVMGGNSNLPKGIALKWVTPIASNFHARHKAFQRSYRYVILNRPVRPTYLSNYVTWFYQPLDEKKMHQAGQYLLGEHNFTSFRAVGCQASHPVRTIKMLTVSRDSEMIYIDITANAFLYNMVRIISGALMRVGQGKERPEWVRKVLLAQDRTVCSATAPSSGLYFVGPQYDPDYGLPSLDNRPRF